MKKYLTRSRAKLLLKAGGVLIAIGLPLNVFVLLRLYGKAGSCFSNTTNTANTCSVTSEQVGSYIAAGLIYLGLAFLLVGVITLIVVKPHKTNSGS